MDPLPKVAVDESQKRRVEAEAEMLAVSRRRDKCFGGEWSVADCCPSLAGELVGGEGSPPPESQVNALAERLSECIDRDAEGRPQLTIRLADDAALKSLATTLAKLLGSV